MLPVTLVGLSIVMQLLVAWTAYLRQAVQVPLLQPCPDEQALVHEPQCAESAWMLTQPLRQQRLPVAHVLPHRPQLLGSVVVFTHVVPHTLGVALGQHWPLT